MNTDKNDILHKYLNGEASPEEIEVLKNSQEYASFVRIANASAGLETPEFDSETNYAKIQRNKIRAKVKRLRPTTVIWRVAAVAVLLIAGYLYFSTLDTTIQTDIAEKENLLLPDQSEVFLNADSELVYNKSNWEDARSLSLKGEAYFKVSKGRTFSVNTPQGVVQVLGTQFNVFARDSIFQVHCYEGLVSVSFNDALVKLPAGYQLHITNGQIQHHTESSRMAPGWIENESTFENTAISFVIRELERQYPIHITSPKSIDNLHFTGAFTHKDLNTALRSVFDPLQIEFKLKGEEVILYAPGE